MAIFTKWGWIKKNWSYVLEEADKLSLVFVGGTSLNLVMFDEYRASEDIDLYNPDSKGIDNPNSRSEEDLVKKLSVALSNKGFEIKKVEERLFYIGPNIKVEIFNDGTAFEKIEKVNLNGIMVPIFDMKTYAKMKLAALLCRRFYDSRDLVDVFMLHTKGNIKLSFPIRECEIIEKFLEERIEDIKNTKREHLLLFQDAQQIDVLPYAEFEKFKRWLVDWLSRFC
ncbi:MAG: nucleotidyl transferase AbiEii/AbiGii toxin family protein [Candidatus Micrarchaeota archaeon]|nr:nucleotidyl transferase AbiEii/AbiGii toxin family protein [Candidatus Micrarchaeota archaeon]